MAGQYNHNLRVVPFPERELPTLFCWRQELRRLVADDAEPRELGEWMEWKREDGSEFRYAVFEGEALKACAEFFLIESGFLEPIVLDMTFKRDFYSSRGELNTRPALNLCLDQVFSKNSFTDLIYFIILSRNRPMRDLYEHCGAVCVGHIQPRQQNGRDVGTELLVLTRLEWERANAEFLDQIRAPRAITVQAPEQNGGERRESAVIIAG